MGLTKIPTNKILAKCLLKITNIDLYIIVWRHVIS